MSETEEPPAKVLKIDNFDQELSIPDIEPIGYSSNIPDGLGDAASVVDGDIPDNGIGDEDSEEIADNLNESGDISHENIEDRETDHAISLSNQITEKIDTDQLDQEADNNEDKSSQDIDKENIEKFDQDLDKINQELEKVTQSIENDQEVEKNDRGTDKTDETDDGSVRHEQNVSGSQEEADGPEEWLSEGILTDEDVNTSINEETKAESSKTFEQNIEETLNHLDGSMDQDEDQLDSVLNKQSEKSDVKQEPTVKQEEHDDGNDTDDLLRMLGDDDNKAKKKLTKTVKDLRNSIKNAIEASDDDDFEYDETSVRKLKRAKNAIISKRTPPKAVPEDMDDGDDDDTDQSSDEVLSALKKKYNVTKTNIITKKLSTRNTENLVVVKKAGTNKQPPVNVVNRRDINDKYIQKKSSSLIKPSILKTSTPAKMIASKPNPDKKTRIEYKPTIKTPAPFTAESILKTFEVKNEHIDEYLDEFGLEEDLESDIEDDLKTKPQISLMKPERMDEEVPSDSYSEDDGSLYDELPSSDSDDMDDWFQIDIRAERATDYLPLLGTKAKELLLEEKQRTTIKLSNLKQSLSALTETGKKQAEELKKATMTLTELDDMLKAS